MKRSLDLPDPKPRISQKVRDAILYRVREGLSIKAAAERASLSRNGFAKALKRPHVIDLLEQERQVFVLESEALRASYRALSLEHAWHLAKNAKSETVQARMVEFLAGEPKSAQVAVNIDNRRQKPIGYAYVEPGKKIVDVTSLKEDHTGKRIVRIFDTD